jgi:Putative beta-barrel porin-2, OmpL-like. bbp2
VASFVLSCTIAATDARGQDGPKSSEDPRASPSTKAKQRPRLLERMFGGKTPPDPKVAPTPPAPRSKPSNAPAGSKPVAKPPSDPAVVPAQLGADTLGYSYENIGDIQIGSQADQGFLRRVVNAYRNEVIEANKPKDPDKAKESEPKDPDERPEPVRTTDRRALPAPFQAPPMPFSDFIGPLIGVNDTSVFPLMEAFYTGPNGQAWKDSRFKIYGWADPSYNASTSRNSNVPLAYNIVPNSLQLSQQVVILERTLDTVQTDHFDWGFRFTSLYGIDFRFTTAKGWFSNQLLKHNHLYGYDPLQLQLDLYFPNIGEGTIMRIGRYISPLDIEAQLSPDNFLYSHSIMFGYDPYTFTGVQFTTKIDDNFTITYGVHAGNDMAPWTKSSQPNGEILIRWVAPNNKDSLYGGIDSIGKGYYSNGHDDLQVFGFTWSHKFNDKFTTMTEQYYIWQRNALAGGSVVNGTPQPYFESTGPGKLIHGLSDSYGMVNYTSYVLDDKSLVVFRSSCLADFQGQRTGIAGTYFEHTLGYIYHITPWAILRPEVRFEYTSGQKGYDNGTKRDQFVFSMDLIVRF